MLIIKYQHESFRGWIITGILFFLVSIISIEHYFAARFLFIDNLAVV